MLARNPVIEAIRAADRAQAKAEALVAILAARGPLEDAQRKRILAERDVAQLERRIDCAIAGITAAEVLAEP